MADETHYHEFLKLINVDPNNINSHILDKYADFTSFRKSQNNLNTDQAFQKWCSLKIIEQPSASLFTKGLVSPIKTSNLVWDNEDFGFPDILNSFEPNHMGQTSCMHTPPKLPPLPPPPPPPTEPQAKHTGKTMENLMKLKQKIKRNKTVGRPSRMETLSKLANNTLFQKTLHLVAKDKNEVKKTLPILTTKTTDLQCSDEEDFKIYEYITKERKNSLENIQREKEKLVSLMHVEGKLNSSEKNSNENM